MARWPVVVALIVVACGRPGSGVPNPGGLPALSALREYAVPWADAYPGDAVVDSAGRVWFTDRLTHAIGVFDPVTEEFRRYPTPSRRSTPYGMIVAPDGTLWYAAASARGLGRVDPATAGIIEYPIPDAEGGPQLLVWRDGQIWFSLREGRGYGRFDTVTGESTVYRLEQAHRPYSVTATAHAVWFSLHQTFRLLEVDPTTGVATFHDLNTAAPTDSMLRAAGLTEQQLRRVRRPWGGSATRIAADRAGGIWITDFTRGRVVRYDPPTGTMSWHETVERGSEPYGIATGAGLVWWGEKGTNRVVVLAPGRRERLRVPLSVPGGVIRNIAVDEARGRVWLPLSDRPVLGLIEYR
jgi:virginiamycin B lyase